MKHVLKILAFILLAGIASAAGENKIHLRVLGLPDPSSTNPNSIARQCIIQRFLELNPDIELIPAEGLRIKNLVNEATTLMMIAGGVAPDVLQLNFRSLDTYVNQGVVASLNEYVAAEKAKGIDVLSRIQPQVKDVVYRPDPSTGERKLYGLPTPLLVRGIAYNHEIFRRAGLPDRAPADWKELEEFSAKIKALGKDYYGIYFHGGSISGWDLMTFIWSAGGDAVKEVGPNQWKATFDSPEALAAYAFYYKMTEIDGTALSTATIKPETLNTRIGMTFSYVGDTTLDAKISGFGAVPKGPTGKRGAEVNASVLSVFSQIKDPAVKDAAWRYILFMTGPEAERISTATMVDLGQASLVNPLALKRFGYQQFLVLTPPGFEKEYAEALKTGKPEPYGKNCNLIYQEMTGPLDQIRFDENIRNAWMQGNQKSALEQMQAILNTSVARTNERMVGYVPPETMKFRRMVALIVVIGIICIFVFVGWYIVRIFSNVSDMSARPVNSRSWIPWVCLTPALGLILIWSYIPLARGSIITFQDFQLILKSEFVGLDNFASALFDSAFWHSCLATLHYAAYTLTFGFAAPILLAYGLHLIPKYKILYRTVYYLPAIISGTAVFFLWSTLFGVEGPLNQVLRLFGFTARHAWTDDPYLAMLSCVIPGIWAGMGPGCLIYLAALKTIPEEQFEAAEIDGASFLSKTVNIVYPGLKALVFINFVGAIAAAFHGSSNILVMTGGGPNDITTVVSLKIFFEAFTRLRFGPATAMAWVIGSMLIGVTVMQLQRLSRMEFKTAK